VNRVLLVKEMLFYYRETPYVNHVLQVKEMLFYCIGALSESFPVCEGNKEMQFYCRDTLDESCPGGQGHALPDTPEETKPLSCIGNSI
jgi:hypothetical protein